MSNTRGACKNWEVNKRFTNLELIGEHDCDPERGFHQKIDLDVWGGARIRKSLCAQDIYGKDQVLTGNLRVMQEIGAEDITAEKITAQDICADTVSARCFVGNIKGTGGEITTEKIVVEDCIEVAGNLSAAMACLSNVIIKDDVRLMGDFSTTGDLIISGNLQLGMLSLMADLTVGNATVDILHVGTLKCGDLQVDNLHANTLNADMFMANVFTTKGDLSIAGEALLAGDFSVAGDLAIAGNLQLGMLELMADLTVGNASVNKLWVDTLECDDLNVETQNVDMAMANVFQTKGDLVVDGDLIVDNIEANIVTSEMAMANVLVVKQDEVVQGNLIIQGGTQLVANIGDITISEIGLSPTLLDAFGRQKVSNPFTLIDNKFLSNRELEQWDELVELTGNITYQRPYLTLEAFTAGDRAIRQTRQYLPYQPGKGLSILATGTLEVSGNADVTTRIGFFDDANDKDLAEDTEGSGNGYFFEWDGTTVYVVERSFISGTQVDTKIPQTSWNIDTFDGSGPSGLILDLTKRQIFTFELEWLGVGSVVTGFFIGRQARWAHVFYHANLGSDLPYITRPTLPVRYEASSQGGVATMRQICATVISDGGYEPKGGIYSASMGAGTTTSIGSVHTPLIAIRLKRDFRRVTLNLLKTTILAVSGNDFYVALYRFVAPTTDPFTGAYTWQSAGPNSAAEYMVNLNATDITSFTNTDGVLLDESYVSNRIDTGGSDLADRLGAIVTANISGYSDILVVAAGPDMGVQAAAAMQWQELE
jgi:hypothetical protein